MPKVDQSILTPGRAILYRPANLIGVIISIKTWSWTSHIEVVVSPTTAVAARFDGVDEYPIRNDKYVCGVLEPTMPFDLATAMVWFNTQAKGDCYDLGGLFGFYLPKDGGNGKKNFKAEFCSMLADLFYIAGGFKPFAPAWPAKKVAPAQFWQSPLFKQIYP
jgi:hypothetical protein